MSFISSAATNRPQLAPNGFMVPDAAAQMKAKIVTLLAVAIENGHEAIVLSAFGCGAFRCPPLHVAKLFYEALQELGGGFKKVVFAIFNDHNAKGEGNVKPFADVFETKAQLFEGWKVQM